MIKACLNIYNDMPTLPFTLSSLIGYVDEIIAIDGPYSTVSNAFGSSDGTTEYLEKHGAKVISGCWKNQLEKRNAYVKQIHMNDYMLIIDGDELLINGWYLQQIEDNAPLGCYGVQTVFPYLGPYDMYPSKEQLAEGFHGIYGKWNRLVKKTHPNMQYRRKHYYLFLDDLNNTWHTNGQETPLMIYHMHFLRPYSRKIWKLKQYKERYEWSQEGRGAHGFWLHPNCWETCYIFNAYLEGPNHQGVMSRFEAPNYQCSSDVNGVCHARPGYVDVTRIRKQYGPMILWKDIPAKKYQQITKALKSTL